MRRNVPARAMIDCILCAECGKYATATGGGTCEACAIRARITELIAALAQRDAELAEARKDSERLDEAARGQYSIRYNAMNEKWEVTTGDLHPAHRRSASRKTLRAAIDAARGQK